MDSTKNDTLELIRTFLPKYLTPDELDDLFQVVKEKFPLADNPNLIYTELDDNYYQGDCIIDIPFAVFNKGEFKTIYNAGIITSNTCDISPENKRDVLPNVHFSFIYSLAEYIAILKKKNISQKKIDSFKEALKYNRISNLFYLPKYEKNGHTIMEESFVRFDSTVSIPIDILHGEPYDKKYLPGGDRILSFNNYGFYLFLIKISIHYCRFREGVFRGS